QRVAVKTNFSGVPAVICPDCNIHHAIYINRCSFRISDGWQRKKPLHPPEIHSSRLDACFLFLMLLSAFSASSIFSVSILLL
ncbi:MAG: hypothetical protein SOW77_07315, partial [Ruminococcus sp.]|nr:hypothetical protein [Ruminococcus sp.]